MIPYLPPPPDTDTVQVISCTKAAVDLYGIGKDRALVLISVLQQEGGKRNVANPRRNGTKDQGWWQINSHWNATLGKYGINEKSLTNDPCLASYTAAWVFRQKLEMAGGDLWKAVGLYRSANEPYHSEYIRDVSRKYEAILSNKGFLRYFYSIEPYYGFASSNKQ